MYKFSPFYNIVLIFFSGPFKWYNNMKPSKATDMSKKSITNGDEFAYFDNRRKCNPQWVYIYRIKASVSQYIKIKRDMSR
jgi:hypothetical protein